MKISLLAFITLLACSPTTIPAKTATALERGLLAAGFYCANKRIRYLENKIRPMWFEERVLDVTFEGFWDIDTDLGRLFASALRRAGLRAMHVDAALSGGSLSANEVGGSICAVAGQGTTGEPSDALDPFWDEMRRSSVTYVAYWCAGPYVVSVTGGAATLGMSGVWRFFDVARGRVVYSQSAGLAPGVHYKKSMREIEQYDMIELRRATERALMATVPDAIRLSLGRKRPERVGFVRK